ncbi:hypothetical protein N9Y81_01395 [Akkermansiaceae bacterium]|jgi:hypothetical protein|nr:hypothetical protein [Akkermansiaceae bacterium]
MAVLWSDEPGSNCSADLCSTVIGIAVILGIAFALFIGLGLVVSKRRLPYLIRPSLSTSPFDRRVVLQFQHFAGYFLIFAGLADVFRNMSQNNAPGTVEIPAFGFGLLFGTLVVLRLFRRRFHLPQAEPRV